MLLYKSYYYVRKILQCNLNRYNHLSKLYSTKNGNIYIERLRNKRLIQLKGEDSASLLQGLMTNDVHHLAEDSKAIYTMFLNNKGRVMCDNFVVRGHQEDTYIIECDSSIAPVLEKHLKKYKLRKKVELTPLNDDFSVSVVYCLNDVLTVLPEELVLIINEDEALKHLVNSESDKSLNDLDFGELLVYRDPRLPALGLKIIVPNGYLLPELRNPRDTELYRLCRYWLGVAEGPDEMPVQDCFPLECNCDYLHGVSFHKGCYVGQELTARSHHTGVIRKRVMPVVLETGSALTPPSDVTGGESTKRLGKLRGCWGKYAIALLRTAECLKLPSIRVGDRTARCFKPTWWPQESHKINKQLAT